MDCLTLAGSGVFKDLADRLRTFTDETRLLIMLALYDGDKTVAEIAAYIDRPYPNIIQHIQRLQKAGYIAKSCDRYPVWSVTAALPFESFRQLIGAHRIADAGQGAS